MSSIIIILQRELVILFLCVLQPICGTVVAIQACTYNYIGCRVFYMFPILLCNGPMSDQSKAHIHQGRKHRAASADPLDHVSVTIGGTCFNGKSCDASAQQGQPNRELKRNP